MDTTKVPGHTRVYPSRLDLDPGGLPLVFASGVGGIGYDEHVLRWNDSAWLVVQQLGYLTSPLHTVVSTENVTSLVWQTYDRIALPGVPYLACYLVSAEFVDDRYSKLDTISTVFSGNFVYSAATSARRRWAVKSDGPYRMRAWYSDTAKVWHGVFLPGGGGYGAAVAAIDDTSALVTWLDFGAPIRWGILRGSVWEDGGIVPGNVFPLAQFPHFRRSPSGTLWMAWSTDREFIQYTTYRNGAWALPESLSAPKPTAGRWVSKELRPSRDRWELPVITWVEHNASRGYLGTVCVSVPTETGHPPGENLAGTDDAIFAESVRDSLGDVWLVWRSSNNGMFWTHSYVRATATKPRLTHHGRRRTLSWTLSEPAPGSWWTVLRSRGDGPFEEAAQVQAGEGLDVSWADDSRLRGGRGAALVADDETDHGRSRAHVRYKVRRDCLDTRYQWESEEVSWPPRVAHDPPRHQPRLKPPLRPWRGDAMLEVADAAPGAVQVALYDLQGREVMSERVERSAEGGIRFPLDRAREPLRAGVYFARVRDASGAWSGAVRAVVLR